MNIKHRTSAFTLVELLMVIVVIMVLVGISLPVSKYVTKRINDERAKLIDAQIKDGLEQYRLAYGEYPIPGSENHYPVVFINDPEGELPRHLVPCPINLSTNVPPLETIPLTTTFKIDYSLTWPLMLGPISRGEPPYVVFPEVTVTYLMYKDVFDASRQKKETRYERDGKTKTEGTVALGKPIIRFMAISPRSGKQYGYSCTNGEVYTLTDYGVQ